MNERNVDLRSREIGNAGLRNCHDPSAIGREFRGQLAAPLVVDIYYIGVGFLAQASIEKLFLRVEVVFHRQMVVEMIASEIRKNSNPKTQPVAAMQVDCLR